MVFMFLVEQDYSHRSRNIWKLLFWFKSASSTLNVVEPLEVYFVFSGGQCDSLELLMVIRSFEEGKRLQIIYKCTSGSQLWTVSWAFKHQNQKRREICHIMVRKYMKKKPKYGIKLLYRDENTPQFLTLIVSVTPFSRWKGWYDYKN
jgi:hypothetical protein